MLSGPQGSLHPTKWKIFLKDTKTGREWMVAVPIEGTDKQSRSEAYRWANHLDRQGYLL